MKAFSITFYTVYHLKDGTLCVGVWLSFSIRSSSSFVSGVAPAVVRVCGCEVFDLIIEAVCDSLHGFSEMVNNCVRFQLVLKSCRVENPFVCINCCEAFKAKRRNTPELKGPAAAPVA